MTLPRVRPVRVVPMANPFNLFAKFSLFRVKSRMRGETVRRYTVTNPFHAVSVLAGPAACQAARGCAGTRFLSTEAPPLPLPGCDAAACKCRYQHHTDRRSGLRRGSDAMHYQNHFWQGQERRTSRGRRVTDL